jgi:hypothetical protein
VAALWTEILFNHTPPDAMISIYPVVLGATVPMGQEHDKGGCFKNV